MTPVLSSTFASSIVLLFAGFIAGFYGASVGSGSLVSFPTLLLLGLPTHIAVATNRFAVFFGELTGAVQYRRKGSRVDIAVTFSMGLVACVGTFLGSRIVIALSAVVLNITIATLLCILLIVLVCFPRLGLVTRMPSIRSKILLVLFAFPLGIYAGFFGAGNGTFLAMALSLSGLSFIESAATARTIGIMTTLVAWVSFGYSGLIDYVHGIPLGLGYAAGCWIGVHVAIKKGNQYVRLLLITIILITVSKLFFDAFT